MIVVDGLSNDGSLELLNKLQLEFLGKLRWISQKDSGPAQAINKALLMFQGYINGSLNSGDIYTPDAISRAVAHFEKHPDRQLVYGFAQHIDAAGFPLGPYPTKPPSTHINEFAKGSFICHPTVFMRKEGLALVD